MGGEGAPGLACDKILLAEWSHERLCEEPSRVAPSHRTFCDDGHIHVCLARYGSY